MRGTPDLALVGVFVEVVRQGSFTGAAQALGTPKSTVSRRVSRLEAELGVQLLVRTTRQLRLTEQGEAFYSRAAPALEGVEEAARAVTAGQEEPRGLLRISVPPDYERLPETIAGFLARYPEVRVEVETAARYVDLVGEGYDLAVRAGRLRDSSLIARKLTTVTFQVFASERYLQRRGVPERADELADHDCVLLRPRPGNTPRWSLRGPGGLVHIEPSGPILASNLVFVRGAVRAGVGIGLLPSHSFDGEEDIRRLLPDHEAPGSTLHIVYPGTRHVPAKVTAFRDHLLAQGWFA